MGISPRRSSTRRSSTTRRAITSSTSARIPGVTAATAAPASPARRGSPPPARERAARRAPMSLPPPGNWPTAKPADAGLDPQRLDDAIAYHLAHETKWRRDFRLADGRYIGVADEPDSAVLGPVRPRGGPSGLVVRGGRLVT